MSDLARGKQKLKEASEWRGTITVPIEGDEHEFTVRQLNDTEFKEVMSMIDREELQSLRDALPDDILEEHRELREADELSEEEEERLEEIEAKLSEEGGSIDQLSNETFEGIQQCAAYGIEPDEEDLQHAFRERAAEIEREYGIRVSTPEDCREALQDDIEEMVFEHSVNFVSFVMGMEVLMETIGRDEGN